MTRTGRDASDSARRPLAVGIPSTGGWKETFLQYSGIPRLKLSSIQEGVEQGIRVFPWNREDPFFRRPDGERIAVVTENGFLKKLLNLEGTGGPTITHTYEGTMGPEQAELLVPAGVDPKSNQNKKLADTANRCFSTPSEGRRAYWVLRLQRPRGQGTKRTVRGSREVRSDRVGQTA